MMSELFEAEVAQVLKRTFAKIRYKVTKISRGLRTLLPESSIFQLEMANFIAMLFNWLPSIREACSVKPSASVSRTSAAAAGTAPSMPAVQSSHKGLQ